MRRRRRRRRRKRCLSSGEEREVVMLEGAQRAFFWEIEKRERKKGGENHSHATRTVSRTKDAKREEKRKWISRLSLHNFFPKNRKRRQRRSTLTEKNIFNKRRCFCWLYLFFCHRGGRYTTIKTPLSVSVYTVSPSPPLPNLVVVISPAGFPPFFVARHITRQRPCKDCETHTYTQEKEGKRTAQTHDNVPNKTDNLAV